MMMMMMILLQHFKTAGRVQMDFLWVCLYFVKEEAFLKDTRNVNAQSRNNCFCFFCQAATPLMECAPQSCLVKWLWTRKCFPHLHLIAQLVLWLLFELQWNLNVGECFLYLNSVRIKTWWWKNDGSCQTKERMCGNDNRSVILNHGGCGPAAAVGPQNNFNFAPVAHGAAYLTNYIQCKLAVAFSEEILDVPKRECTVPVDCSRSPKGNHAGMF